MLPRPRSACGVLRVLVRMLSYGCLVLAPWAGLFWPGRASLVFGKWAKPGGLGSPGAQGRLSGCRKETLAGADPCTYLTYWYEAHPAEPEPGSLSTGALTPRQHGGL